MRTQPPCRPRAWCAPVATTIVLLGLASCSGASGDAVSPSATFVCGPVPNAVEARIDLAALSDVESISFTVASKAGARSRDVHVTYTRDYLEREGALDEAGREARVTIFGLYADYPNDVTLEIECATGATARVPCVVPTDPLPDAVLPTLDVSRVEDGFDPSFLLLQCFGPPAIVDLDGEVRWLAPDTPDGIFPRVQTPEGVVAGSLFSNAIYDIDWFGRVEASVLDDPRCFLSHHNIERGKAGFLDTVSFRDGAVNRPQSVLVEMSETGAVTHVWDFDVLFRERIEACGEDASSLVQNGVDWFHMNSAVYDASDDGILASSRENFVVKVDYETGRIRWLLGNPEKAWFQDFPASLRPLALTVIGDPPVGQHSLSVSPDGRRLMMFDNGKGNEVLDDVGDSRTYSRVSIYEIDEVARTATQIWVYDLEQSVYSPYCSSAYATESGSVVLVCSGPADGLGSRILVVDESQDVLFDARPDAGRWAFIYSAEEIHLDGLRVE